MTTSSRHLPETKDSVEHQLVFAVCHEIGNWVTAIRLQAHLLDEDLGPKDLALASIEIDELCARTSAVFSQMRPLLTAAPPKPLSATAASILTALEHGLTDLGGRGAALSFESAHDLGAVAVDPDALHALLMTAVLGAIDAVRPDGGVRVWAERAEDQVRIVVADDGPEGEDLPSWQEQPVRGRVLACALAERVLRRHGGRLEVARCADETRVAFCLPPAD